MTNSREVLGLSLSASYSPGDGFVAETPPARAAWRFRTNLSENALEKSTSEYGGAGGAAAFAAAAAELSPLPVADEAPAAAAAADEVEGGFELTTPCDISIRRCPGCCCSPPNPPPPPGPWPG